MDSGFLAVLDADARVGQDVALAGLAAQVQGERRVGDEGGHAREVAQVDEALHKRAGGGGVVPQPTVADLVGETKAQFEQTAAGDLQHFHFEHDLGVGDVQRLDQPFGQFHGVGRVLEDEQVEPLVDKDVRGFDQGANHGVRLFHVGVGEVEAAGDQLLVLACLSRCVGVNQQGVVVE